MHEIINLHDLLSDAAFDEIYQKVRCRFNSQHILLYCIRNNLDNKDLHIVLIIKPMKQFFLQKKV